MKQLKRGMKQLKSRIALIKQTLLKISEYKELSLFLYIFLITKTYDLQNVEKMQILHEIPNFTECLTERNTNSNYLIETIKQKIKEDKTDIEKIEDDLYLECKHNSCKVIKLYNNLEKLDDLQKLLDRINECLKKMDGHSLIGYAFLISSVIRNHSDTEIIAQRILSITRTTKSIGVDLPIKSTDKPRIWLFGSIYGDKSDKPPCYLILYQKEYENDAIQYFYNIIPDIFMHRFKIDYIHKEFEKLKEGIENITNQYKSVTEYLENTNIEEMQEKLKCLSKYYNEYDKRVKGMFQITHSAQVNFSNIQRILSAYNLPTKLLFEDCFYEAERKVKEMEFYSDFYQRESNKIEDNIRTVEIQSNILRSKLESIENRQNKLRNIILATAGIIISFLQIFSDDVKSAILYILQIFNNEIVNTIKQFIIK